MSGPTSDAAEGRARRGSSVVRQALMRFTAWSLVALVVLAVGSVYVCGVIARDQALTDGRDRAVAIASTVAAPLVHEAVRSGVPGASDALTEVLENRMRDGSVTHIKLWSQDGTLIWADDASLVGRQFPLSPEVRALFGTTDTLAEVSRLDRRENVRERAMQHGELLEVYVGARDADGVPLVFEAYLSTQRMDEVERQILVGVLPLALGGLLLFQLAVLPAAIALARRVDHSRAEHSRAIHHALLASDLERRRIAEDLHDGVIPDLAGVGYALPSLEADLAAAGVSAQTRQTVQQASRIVRNDVAALRSLLTDIYPPDLRGDNLRTAVEDLAGSLADKGVDVQVTADALDLPHDASRLAYRTVREGLRNAVKHASASVVRVELRREGDHVVVRVRDNGRGLSGNAGPEPGHVGLQLLADTLTDVGGGLRLYPGPAGGAVLEAVYPVTLAVA